MYAPIRGRSVQFSRLWLTAPLVLSLTACSTIGDIFTVTDVKPWQRGTLARDDMQLITDSMELSVDEHIYFSKEGSVGGVIVQGGGCGCN